MTKPHAAAQPPLPGSVAQPGVAGLITYAGQLFTLRWHAAFPMHLVLDSPQGMHSLISTRLITTSDEALIEATHYLNTRGIS